MMDAADQLAGQGMPVPADVLRAVGVATTASFAGEWGVVADVFGPVRPQFGRIGGSRAQREVLDDALVVGLMRSNRGEAAREILTERLSRRPSARDAGMVAELDRGRGRAR
jgi:rRNA processing protein Gar1